ncbi:MAG: calcium-binding protein [Paracoccaceae bacterium]|nr:MAG: calcium-binding protein [Paracoccaceae bacterium]
MPLNPIDGTAEGDTLPGTNEADHVIGYGGDDQINGYGGNDLIEGGDGNDQLFGDTGRDTIYGGDGNDRIEGGPGNDRLYGDAGDDSFAIYSFSGAGIDRAYGGQGNDRMYVGEQTSAYFHGGTGTDLFWLFWNNIGHAVSGSVSSGFVAGPHVITLRSVEQLYITTGNGDDSITGGRLNDEIVVLGGANTVDAGAGNDHVAYLAGSVNHLDGGAGNDQLRAVLNAGGSGTGFAFDASGPVVTDGFGSTILNFERYWLGGSYYRDSLTGGDLRDKLDGNDGDDILSGMGGNDVLRGGRGNDQLFGGDGNDRLSGAQGLDTMAGGAGADTFVFGRPDGQPDLIEDFSGIEGDRIELAAHWFYLAPGGAAPLSHDVASGTGAQFVYETTTGLLYFDSDGVGGGASVQIAVLAGAPVLTAADLVLV